MDLVWEDMGALYTLYINAGHPPRGSASATFNEHSCLTHTFNRLVGKYNLF
jgi:hypothetical protein